MRCLTWMIALAACSFLIEAAQNGANHPLRRQTTEGPLAPGGSVSLPWGAFETPSSTGKCRDRAASGVPAVRRLLGDALGEVKQQMSPIKRANEPHEPPTDADLQAGLIEAASSLGWGLMASDAEEGWFIWRLRLASLAHPPVESRFAWRMKRSDSALEVSGFFVFLDRELAERFADALQREATGLRVALTQRLVSLAGPIQIHGQSQTSFISDRFEKAIKVAVEPHDSPLVLGDVVIVIGINSPLEVNETVVDSAPQGTALEILGFQGERLKVRYHRSATIDRQDVMSLDDAIAFFSEEIERNPQNSAAFSGRGHARGWKGDLEASIADHRQAIRLAPNAAWAHQRMGFARGLQGDAGAAVREFLAAVRLNPVDAAAWNDLGVAHIKANELDNALSALNEAIRLDPQYSVAYMNRGNVWARKGEEQKAIADHTEAIRLDPGNAEAYFNRGLSRIREDDSEKASLDFFESARHSPVFLNTINEWLSRPPSSSDAEPVAP